MSYAKRNDGLGWRSVDSAEDCTADETYSETQPDWSAPPIVPQSVTPLQARQALHAAGLLTSVENAVSQADEATKLAWQFASSIDRKSSFVIALAALLPLTDDQLDSLFASAAGFS